MHSKSLSLISKRQVLWKMVSTYRLVLQHCLSWMWDRCGFYVKFICSSHVHDLCHVRALRCYRCLGQQIPFTVAGQFAQSCNSSSKSPKTAATIMLQIHMHYGSFLWLESKHTTSNNGQPLQKVFYLNPLLHQVDSTMFHKTLIVKFRIMNNPTFPP